MSAGRNLITLFFTVNTLLQFFFYPPSLRATATPSNHPARAHPRPNEKRVGPTAFSKKYFFSAVFFMPCACVAAWALGRRGGEADAAALLAACPPAENFLSNGCTSSVA
ncbi:hypothetical protein [Xanthomonas phaseoli]|uniref:Uncharacterized protein n=1 Tax=Xanthomonas manihotis TaxID=43353 RepID=A0A8I1XPA8_XANMN|nr:hypothetical protein [Xanthomonas phaseoli]MBO9754838.1 hypothetical protein [Xanthomonas phaseoli pv. manihotis]MBO9761106.1 hypothetical protein [Xanthomonas phaseoli pv. manihotis]